MLTFMLVLCATLAVGPAQQNLIELRIDIDDRAPASESLLRGAVRRIPHSPTAVFIFGLVALVVAFIPVLSWLAWVPALAALVGLSRALKSDQTSRRTAFNGMVMGVAAWIIAIFVSVGSLGAGDASGKNRGEEPGAAPIFTGQPGYSRTLDRDGDGVGCES